MDTTHMCILVAIGILLFSVEGAIIEKTASVCNGECSNLLMQCPPDHKIAIREALYGVHTTTSGCPYNMECDDLRRGECCDMPAARDCLFPYPLDHLETFHRNCSGKLQCHIKAQQRPDASPACSPVEHRNISSYSFFDYVCVNDTFTADICSPYSTSMHGRTLFALFDARTQTPPPPGSTCTCVATPTFWTGAERVSAFVVDMRLNKPSSSWCSDSELIMEASPNIHEISCLASNDPYFPYPFVTIINSTNGAIAHLVFNDSPPEFVWVGFEASQDEELELTCGLQPKPTPPPPPRPPVKPIPVVTEDPKSAHVLVPPADQGPRRAPRSIILACAIIGSILIIVIVVFIVVWIRRRQIFKEKREEYNSEDHLYTDVDGDGTSRRRSQPVAIEPLYQTVGVDNSTADVYSSPWDSKSNRKFKDNAGFAMDDEDSDDTSDLYVTSEQVRKNKRSKKERKTSDGGEPDEYVSASEVRKKKKEKRVTFNKNLEEYDRLPYKKKVELSQSGYSHLGMVISELGEELDTTLKEPPKTAETDNNENVETEEKMKTMDIPEVIENDADSTQERGSDEDSGLSTDEDKEGETTPEDNKKEEVTLTVPTTNDRPPSPSPYALAKSFSNGI